MCGSPLTYRARQAAVPRRDGHGSHALPGAACRQLWCVFLFGTGPRGPCNFRTIAQQKEFFRQEFLNNFTQTLYSSLPGRNTNRISPVKKFRAAVGEFVRGSRDRDLVAYYDSV